MMARCWCEITGRRRAVTSVLLGAAAAPWRRTPTGDDGLLPMSDASNAEPLLQDLLVLCMARVLSAAVFLV
jgi:hypothetical protein